MVSREWLRTRRFRFSNAHPNMSKVIYTLALEDKRMLKRAEWRMIETNTDELSPILLAVSDGAFQMVSGATREWMALHSLALHVGRSGIPTVQVHIEFLWDCIKGDWSHLEVIPKPGVLEAERDHSSRLHAGQATSHPTMNKKGEGPKLERRDAEVSERQEPPVSSSVEITSTPKPDRVGS